MYHVLLKMRTYVGIIGEGVPPIEKALTDLIALKEKLKMTPAPQSGHCDRQERHAEGSGRRHLSPAWTSFGHNLFPDCTRGILLLGLVRSRRRGRSRWTK